MDILEVQEDLPVDKSLVAINRHDSEIVIGTIVNCMRGRIIQVVKHY